ncbi:MULTISPECIES: hypothetical protein [unclassified Plantibacter]|uniref:hypothetical protein n=1 Tax=unclassified Plantibacter TaxID=2624265 RepID=UPI0006FC7107|nr:MULTISPECIES: hypothetical protein [unclassified Plantibacter]KQQ51365.1 hypothetical protein ASF68_02595 [Plantibacter sp. Leaf314]
MMNIERWWPKLKPTTRQYLIEHNGSSLPADARAEIVSVGGRLTSGSSWVTSWPDGYYFPAATTQWIAALTREATVEPGTLS